MNCPTARTGHALASVLMMGLLVSDTPAGANEPEPPAELRGTAMCTGAGPTSDVVVYLTREGGEAPLPPPQRQVLDQKNLRFVPHVLPVIVGTVISFPNSDQIQHNVFSASEPRMFNLGTYSSGVSREVRFENVGVVEVLCNVHPEMSAYILVLDTPYFSTTNSDGSFVLPALPAGDYRLFFWCEHKGVVERSISIPGGSTTVEALIHDDLVKQNGRIIKAP